MTYLSSSNNLSPHLIALTERAATGQIAKTIKSGPGFVINRILLPMISEAFFVLAEGDTSATEIDEGMKLGCNHPTGPLALADLIGLDALLAVMQTIHDEFGDSNTGRARCSGRWSPRAISGARPAGLSIVLKDGLLSPGQKEADVAGHSSRIFDYLCLKSEAERL
jgi:hypothetical protein